MLASSEWSTGEAGPTQAHVCLVEGLEDLQEPRQVITGCQWTFPRVLQDPCMTLSKHTGS